MTTETNMKKMLFEGFAKKEGGSIKSWKKRYFRMMDDGVISYYKDQLDAKKLGSIDCNICIGVDANVKGLSTGFLIKTGKERDYKISCFALEERDLFVSAIKSKIHVTSETPAETTESTSEKTEEPSTEEPSTEEPKAEEPRTEEPKAEEPKAEEPKAEEPKAEEPKAEEPKAEEAKAEEPKAEEAKAEIPEAEVTQSEELGEAAVPATETSEEMGPSKAGWLFKSGGGKVSSAYQKRWIQIYDSTLSYSKTEKLGTKVSGTVDLPQALFLSLNIEDAGFNIGTLGRTYNFKAESAEVAIDWVEHLNQFVPEGAQFAHIETSRKQLALSDAADEDDIGDDDAPMEEDKDAKIRTLQARILELEGQVVLLTMAKEATAGEQEATMTLGSAQKAEEAKDQEETMALGSAQKAEDISKPSEATPE